MESKEVLEKKKVLFVDDNEHNLNSFKANFRRDFEVYTAISAKEGYELIEEHDIHVILSDYKMPVENGVLFLENVKIRYPFTVRIMLTGHADLPAVVQAINKGEVYRFLAKPWKNEELKAAIDKAFDSLDTKILLEKKNDELKKAYAELDKLVFSTAHDITGPLSNIMGLVTLIRLEDENTAEYVNLIERTAKKLKMLARDVLSFHRNKRTRIVRHNVRLNQLVGSVLKEHEFYENAQHISYEINIIQDEPVYTDKARLRFILNNLISNAIKYQDAQKETQLIGISAVIRNGKLKLEVYDNGIGIDPSHLSQIFDIYYRGNNNSNGTGIGLYIVKEAIDLLGGEIAVNSQLNEGTRFTIELNNLPE